ncbi:hypothetical protein [Chitinophaga rhizophila]|uniref:Uncharacterized protein n=1 Tax=Chitinophaga rhizophila TaxID=2866212 RepID=A0ABS7G709_9BACT|nr:hypothetical protein [Chitinophaga rhizophila]MBW8683191.1 hypothetical protein [Chitinophaga rhizophila]
MKKHVATIGFLLVTGGFIYFGGSSSPSYAADTTSDEVYVPGNSQFNQDTVPRTDTSRHKAKKMKNKNKKDTTWRNDSIPQ